MIGVLTGDYPLKTDKTTYIFASYTKWLEQHGIRWVPINIYENIDTIEEKLSKL